MAEKKAVPVGTPPSHQEAVEAPRVRMRVDGGNRDERYEFHFEVSSTGTVRYGMRCQLSGRRVPDQTNRMDPAEVERLVKNLDVAKLKRASSQKPRAKAKPIPPCSLVGKLEVMDGKSVVQLTFMADVEQAKHAGRPMPKEVARAVQAIYGLAARQMGLQDAGAVRP